MAQESQRILIVDDEAPLRDIFAKGLSRNGYSCDTAGSADEANNLLRVEEFDSRPAGHFHAWEDRGVAIGNAFQELPGYGHHYGKWQ